MKDAPTSPLWSPLVCFETTSNRLVEQVLGRVPTGEVEVRHLSQTMECRPVSSPVLIRAIDGVVTLQLREGERHRPPMVIEAEDPVDLVAHFAWQCETVSGWVFADWLRALRGRQGCLYVIPRCSVGRAQFRSTLGVMIVVNLGPEGSMKSAHAWARTVIEMTPEEADVVFCMVIAGCEPGWMSVLATYD